MVLQTILALLPVTLPVPVVIVQHISEGFVQGFVDWLGRTSALPVQLAVHQQRPEPGRVYIAPDGLQPGIRNGLFHLNDQPPEHGVRPSVSYLFRSALNAFGPLLIGVLLSGMGKDGAAELKALKDAGAVTVAQDKASSVIHGMPGVAIALGGATHVLPPRDIAKMITDIVLPG